MKKQHYGQSQILRESAPVVDLAREPRASRSWQWVCSALVSRDKGECYVNVVESVFIDKQQIWSWYFTDGGVVRRKPRSKLTADQVHRAFVQFADESDSAVDPAIRPIAVCWFEKNDNPTAVPFLNAPDLLSFLQSVSSSSSCSAAISTFVRPRGELDPVCYTNLEHEFTLQKSGRVQSKVFWLALGGQRIASKDIKLNTVVNELVQHFITFIERNKKCRVVRCVSLFITEDSGKLQLWRTSSCETIAATATLPLAPRGFPDALVSTFSSSYEGPRAMNERLIARARAEGSPDERVVEAIMAAPASYSSRISTRLLPSSNVSNRLDPLGEIQSRRRANLSSTNWDEALSFLPSSFSLSRGRRRTKSAAHLMSSQKRGCCGDFCSMSIAELTARRMDRKKGSTLSEQAGHARKGRRPTSVDKVAATASAFMEVRRTDDLLCRLAEHRKPSSPQRLQRVETQQPPPLTHTIPFKLVAQTRAEKQLVDLFIRRYQNGEDGDYLAEAYYGDGEPLGVTFPGYYYRDVQVCANCYEFYMLVEKVRMKALDQIARREKTSPNRRNPDKQSGKRVQHLTIVESREEESDEDNNNDENLDSLQHVWKQVWAQTASVAAAITKKDAAELYSFVNPHPAVAMVMSALGALLLGSRGGDWGEVKRIISQDKLLARLHRVDLESLSERAVMQAAAHARNPLFTPAQIAPISSCAARFCDWIRTVLQAYAWNQRLQLQDSQTRRMLCLLKPEILPPGAAISQLQEAHSEKVTMKKAKPTDTSSGDLKSKSRSRKQAARRAMQAHQMARLAAPSGLQDGVVGSTADSVFTCQDGVTQIPYAVIGQPIGETVKCNLVVFHDLFDTLESTRVFFRPIVARNVGAQALLFNFPGQAGSCYAVDDQAREEDKLVLNNMWLARRVHELLNFLQHTTQFVTTGAPFHIVGFGNGANVATCYTVLYGKNYDGYLQSLALFNGFASVDAQLAAVLHSAVNVFACLPPTRPDLPVSFFSKFLFSEAYLQKVDMNLALSIYTAVTNAITLDGRIRLCRGALRHVDMSSQLEEIDVPLVLVQSVENTLVAPTNVDPFLQGRANVQHVWSHQQSHTSDLRPKTRAQLRKALATPSSAFVSWLRAGHELRQEAKSYVTEVIEMLVNCQLEILEKEQIAVQEPDENQTTTPNEHETATRKELAARQSNVSQTVQAASSTSEVPIQPFDSPVDKSFQLTSKSPYELQLERSERSFQEALRTREAQKIAYEKKKWQQNEVKTIPPEVSAPTTEALEISITQSVVPMDMLLPPAVPPVVLHSQQEPDPGKEAETPENQQHEKSNSAQMDDDIKSVRAKIHAEEERLEKEAEEQRQKHRAATEERMTALRDEQERRRREWEQEDLDRLAALEAQLQAQQAERLTASKQRDLEQLAQDEAVIAANNAVLETPLLTLEPSVEMPTSLMQSPSTLLAPSVEETRQMIRQQPELPSIFDQLEAEEQVRKKRAQKRRSLGPGFATGSHLTGEQYDELRSSLQQDFREDTRANESNMKRELRRRRDAQATRVQKYIRRFLATCRVDRIRRETQQERVKSFAGGEIVRIARGRLGRRRFRRVLEEKHETARQLQAATLIETAFRGFFCRVAYRIMRRESKARMLQRVYRGHLGRKRARRQREEQERRRFQDRNAAKLQSTWRMYVARGQFLTARFSELAALEIQRMYRGFLGRRQAARKKQWRDAPPGAERLALGLQLIEGSKQAFERQQSELDALHRAQEAAERQVSAVHNELREAEKELAVLERELQEIDQLDADVRELTHEAERLHAGGVEGLLRNHRSSSAHQPLGNGIPEASTSLDNSDGVPYELGAENALESKEALKKRQADAYAVEMALTIKRSEREKKKRDLEAEFAGAFAEVQRKREDLAALEERLADMEQTRMRKDREFARLQRHLMELLEEQKLELENLREKGIELETATATSAAAAAATAAKAREHEERSQAMFESTEELMKFQFMSMSLSYFSSLNMLKNLRDINADTTAAAITSTAETAATAACAAAAANITPVTAALAKKKAGGDAISKLLTTVSQRKQQELTQQQREEEEALAPGKQQPLPVELRAWTVDDVGRWLDTLSLPQYKAAFREGAVDGEFLIELRAEDMAEILGVTHKLHVRKLLTARSKLLPLTAAERAQLDAVNHETNAARTRGQEPAGDESSLDVDTVFSQARNGRMKRLVESLDAGFPIDGEDDKGNTLLLLACQNVNQKMVELLVARRANVNHCNAQGNTPLHFAMAYDSEGVLGEYLIAHGADDTIENNSGLTPYDGLTAE
ncbi:Ankyrin repeats domain-containing protein [Phytophthora infestans]|uniref:Ankyrin repeats domain-containing protein n=1 Tax=Phytophthora infestans TaxID=4787 RepID=A0A8S9UBU4_PHYIN|nr:Ankyrin repeats domain-containing protein [Phytophthora infestans]